jgi:hypothetical protein
VLAIDRNGMVVRDSGPINWLNPGGGNFEPDGRYYVGLRSARTIMAFVRFWGAYEVARMTGMGASLPLAGPWHEQPLSTRTRSERAALS